MKRLLSILMVVAFAVSSVACTASKTPSETVTESENSNVGGLVTNNGATETELSKKDYDGAYFKFLYWYEPSEIIQRKVAAFNKAHNANVEITVVTGNLEQNLAIAIASGTPYDIIAMHGQFYPEAIFQNLLEPLNSYVSDGDMYDNNNPQNGGLSPVISKFFDIDGKDYALGSAKSIYLQMMVYNKKMFSDAGLEDPYQLYKSNKWTWDKFMEMGTSVTDISNGISFLENPYLYPWLTLNGINVVTQKDNTFTENLTDSNVIAAIQAYQDLYIGDKAICLTEGSGVGFFKGQSYMQLTTEDAYTMSVKNVKTSSAFGRDAANLGAVPVPITNLNKTGAYPGHAPQGYSVCKGASDPSVAACYALFESRLVDSDTGSESQLPAEIRNTLENTFSTNGFLSYCGFTNSNGVSVQSILNNDIASQIRKGADTTAILNSNRSVLSRAINDVMSQK